MAEISDINKIRKKRQRKILLGRVLLLAALTLAGVGLYVLKGRVNAIQVSDNLRDLLAVFGSGPEFPIDFAGEQVKDMRHTGQNLVILTDTNLYVFNSHGKELRSVQHKFSNPMMRVAGSRVLIYDMGGKRLRVESFTRTVSQWEFSTPIYAGAISVKGDVAVATSAPHFTGAIYVYEQTFTEDYKFLWRTPDHYFTGLAFTQDGKGIAAATVSARDGDLIAGVHQYRLDRTEPVAENEFPGQIIHMLECTREGVLAVTDLETLLLDEKGRTLGSYDYGYEALVSFDISDGGCTALLLGDYRGDKTGSLVLLDPAANRLWERNISSQVEAMSIDDTWVGVMVDGKLTIYDTAGQEVKRHTLPGALLDLELVGSSAYYITPETIERLTL